MRYLKYLALLAILTVPFAYSQAQVQVGIGVGVGPGYVAGPPACAYGYYNYYPYACAPYGYYGPDYFVDGLFVGVGPWYHWGHPAEFWSRGWDQDRWYGRRDWDRGREAWGRGWEGRRDFAARHDGYREDHGRGYARGNEGGFRGGQSFRGGESHGGGGGFHGGGGSRGWGRR